MSEVIRMRLCGAAAMFLLVLIGTSAAFGYDLQQDEYGHIIHWDASDIPVPYVISTAYMPPLPGILDAMTGAFATWEAVPSAAISFQFLGTTSNPGTPWIIDPDTGQLEGWTADGFNTVSWITAGTGTPLYDGLESFGVNWTWTWYSRVDGSIIENDTWLNVSVSFPAMLFPLDDEDECFSPAHDVAWSTTGEDGRLDVQGILTHEIGHMIGIDHSTVPDSTMEDGGLFWPRHTRKDERTGDCIHQYEDSAILRTLQDDDIEAVSMIYPVPGVPYVSGGGEPSGRGGGCLISTAAFGTPLADEVKTLCEFRDTVLMPSPLGRQLVQGYEVLSPMLAEKVAGNPVLRAATRVALVPVVSLARTVLEVSHRRGVVQGDHREARRRKPCQGAAIGREAGNRATRGAETRNEVKKLIYSCPNPKRRKKRYQGSKIGGFGNYGEMSLQSKDVQGARK